MRLLSLYLFTFLPLYLFYAFLPLSCLFFPVFR
ncbi:hypothetical [Yersinia pseudotuberculosis IP 32953]|uniref:Uncharacterized protein n=1 Tax=Yersinia pseudotuberculosis serotype I (strain IP32953) TaxID=273123 RepID=Q667G0_YERPS|nr:hypothetical [Yersinia pseudotuberculosis IP 32953]